MITARQHKEFRIVCKLRDVSHRLPSAADAAFSYAVRFERIRAGRGPVRQKGYFCQRLFTEFSCRRCPARECALDFLLIFISFPAAALLMVMISASIRFSLGRPVFYRQQRVGQCGIVLGFQISQHATDRGDFTRTRTCRELSSVASDAPMTKLDASEDMEDRWL